MQARVQEAIVRFVRLLLCLSSILSALFGATPAVGQSAGDSVNMVSGIGWTNGDPFLQRQNEPSLAVSTRNTLHLLGGANDYRSVDIAGLAGQSERADAWLGVFKSFDGGQTWQSTLLPGFPLDSSPAGTSSPLHGFQAAADPTVRAGTNGLFYYSGIAFNRGTNGTGVVFVSRFIDNDNKENGDPTHTNGSLTNLAPTDPIQYLSTVIVDSGNSGQFLDKPWIATDVPHGTATCSVPFTKAVQEVTFPVACSTTAPASTGCAFDQGTTAASFRTSAFPALTVDDTGRVYLAWSQRQATGDARIMMQVSADGLNWSSAPAL